MILLTKSSIPIIGQLASIMGWIMDGIYRVLDLVGIQNLPLAFAAAALDHHHLLSGVAGNQAVPDEFLQCGNVLRPEQL